MSNTSDSDNFMKIIYYKAKKLNNAPLEKMMHSS